MCFNVNGVCITKLYIGENCLNELKEVENILHALAMEGSYLFKY